MLQRISSSREALTPPKTLGDLFRDELLSKGIDPTSAEGQHVLRRYEQNLRTQQEQADRTSAAYTGYAGALMQVQGSMLGRVLSSE